MLTRRSFLASAGATAAVSTLSSLHAQAIQPPNILFLIADDWSFGHAGADGHRLLKTPHFDRIAREGAHFTHSLCIAPSCSPSRASILTGRPPHQLEHGANLWGSLPEQFKTYPDLLEAAGYHVGLTGKGWGPGRDTNRKRNPAGPRFRSPAEFFKTIPANKPFCYWFGSSDPHRPYDRALGQATGIRPDGVHVPPIFPDAPQVRDDLIDYFAEVQRFDAQIGQVLQTLDSSGRANNTIVFITSDNGMPFPHCKANLYDSGTRVPLAIRWPARIKPGQSIDTLTNSLDLAPTILSAAGIPIPQTMLGRNLLQLLDNPSKDPNPREQIFLERERHAFCRAGNLSYPCRAIRTRQHLYILNLAPDRWPAGDPDLVKSQGVFSDIDAGPTKTYLLENRADPQVAPLFHLATAKRPADELYDVITDPWQMNNVAADPRHAPLRDDLRARLLSWMKSTADPRSSGPAPQFDDYEYFGK